MRNSDDGRGRTPHWSAVGLCLVCILGVAPLVLSEVARPEHAGLVPTGTRIALPAPPQPATAPIALAGAEPEQESPDAAQVALDARTLLELFQSRDYHMDGLRTGEDAVPRLVLSALPGDLPEVDDPDTRKTVFVKTMLPIVLLVNEGIERDRQRLERIHAVQRGGYGVAPKDLLWLSDLAARYGMPNDGSVDAKALLRRVDVVPPSLTLAQAAEESGWGSSRFAQDGNALFGQLTWRESDPGIVPLNRRPGESHRFRSFADLKASVEAYMRNLNTHRAYEPFRRMRASLRAQNKPLDSLRLAASLERYSERGSAYVEAIRTVIRTSKLTDFDRLRLQRDQEGSVEPAEGGYVPVSLPTDGTSATAVAPPR